MTRDLLHTGREVRLERAPICWWRAARTARNCEITKKGAFNSAGMRQETEKTSNRLTWLGIRERTDWKGWAKMERDVIRNLRNRIREFKCKKTGKRSQGAYSMANGPRTERLDPLGEGGANVNHWKLYCFYSFSLEAAKLELCSALRSCKAKEAFETDTGLEKEGPSTQLTQGRY